MSPSQVRRTVVAMPPPTFVSTRRAPGKTIPVVLVMLGVSIWIAWMVFSTRDCGASRSGGEVEVGTPAATRPKHDTIQRAVIKGDAPGESMDEQPEREAPKKREKNAREARKKLEKKAREAGKNRRKRERDD
jgi:hypothetical protein